VNPDDIAKILDDLGQRLGPTGERVFALAVRQVTVEAVVWLALCVAIPVLLWIVTAVSVRWLSARDPSDADAALGMLGLFAVIATIGGVLLGAHYLIVLLNPEYAALEKLLGAIR
jgi:hypothetical protein